MTWNVRSLRVCGAVACAVAVASFLSGCSINRLAVRAVSGVLTGGGGSGAFGRDDDPELVAQALPFALKLYESLLDADPQNPALLLATGSAFTMYGYAFVQAPADLLPDEETDRQAAEVARARRLFLRGRDYVFKALELKYPGKFMAYVDHALTQGVDLVKELSFESPKDVDYLYWAAASWMAAVSAAQFDMSLIVTVPKAVAMIRKVLALNDAYGAGGAHDLLVSYYGAGLDPDPNWKQRAKEHYEKAVALSGGKKAGMHISYAMAVTVGDQDIAAFRALMDKALAVDLAADPDGKLENVIAQRKARWLLDHIDKYFLSPEEEQ
jgi:predicted anti-sigma-YlaC factor YlaD